MRTMRMWWQKPMNFSHVSLSQFIDEFDLIGIMIADRPLKASCWCSLSLESIRPLRHLESEPNELQHLKPSCFMLGMCNISLPKHASMSGLPFALMLQCKSRHHVASNSTVELWKRHKSAYVLLLRSHYHRSSCTLRACNSPLPSWKDVEK